MKQAIKCKLGMHSYDVLDTKELRNTFDITTGEVIISRCKHCGKITKSNIYTRNIN